MFTFVFSLPRNTAKKIKWFHNLRTEPEHLTDQDGDEQEVVFVCSIHFENDDGYSQHSRKEFSELASSSSTSKNASSSISLVKENSGENVPLQNASSFTSLVNKESEQNVQLLNASPYMCSENKDSRQNVPLINGSPIHLINEDSVHNDALLNASPTASSSTSLNNQFGQKVPIIFLNQRYTLILI